MKNKSRSESGRRRSGVGSSTAICTLMAMPTTVAYRAALRKRSGSNFNFNFNFNCAT
jgi:hypothetical protein